MSSSGSYDGYFTGDGVKQPTNWKIGELIVRSGYASIYHVAEWPPAAAKCAVKQIFISNDNDKKTLEGVDNEIKPLKNVKHHRIIDYYGYSRTTNVLSLFMAYMEKGSLATYLKTQPGDRLTEKKIAVYTYQILEGLEYLHEKNIIHRDIKGSNILMQDDNNIKISDFGVAKVLTTLSRATTKQKGTINWMAPELFQENTPYKFEVDIWSLGCTVYQMFTGKAPFTELNEYSIQRKADKNELELSIPEQCSDKLKDFLKLACAKLGKNRPTAHNLMQHPFLREDTEETSVMKADIPIPFYQDDVNYEEIDRPSLSSGAYSGIGYQSQAGRFNSSVQVDGTRDDPVASAQQKNSHHAYSQDAPLRGKLNPVHEKKIRKNWTRLLDELDAEQILPFMYQHNIIFKEDMDIVKAEKTTRNKTEKFLTLLLRAGRRAAFDVFIASLQETYPHLAEIILKTV